MSVAAAPDAASADAASASASASAPAARPRFHPLRVARIQRETPDAVSLVLDVPPDLAERFRFRNGQYLTLRAEIGGEDLRRSYSICAGTGDGVLRVAVKEVPGGRFSRFVNRSLQVGDVLQVMPPAGGFCLDPDPELTRHYVAFAAGSGLTPVLSHLKTLLTAEPSSRFTLFLSNRNAGAILFREELEDLKDRWLGRFRLIHLFSRQKSEIALHSGRIDRDKAAALLKAYVAPESVDAVFLCGPQPMIEAAREAARAAGIAEQKILFELFGSPLPVAGGGEAATAQALAEAESGAPAEVTMVLDGQVTRFEIRQGGLPLLDAGINEGLDLPYACKGGVCATCKAKLTEGQVSMPVHYGLEEDELARGYILTCQARAMSDRIGVDFDAVH